MSTSFTIYLKFHSSRSYITHCNITAGVVGCGWTPTTSITKPILVPILTSLHHVVHGGETFENGRADRAEDEQRRQTGVAHHGSSQQAASLVAPLEAPRQDAHEPVRERDAGVLAPPPVHHQGHIETCKQKRRRGHW